MISVLRTVCSSARSCFPGTAKKHRVLEKRHTREENVLDPLKLNVPWQEWLDWTLSGSSESNASKDTLLGLLPTELCMWMGGGSRLWPHHLSPCWPSLDPFILMCLTVLFSLKVLSHARLREHLGEVFSHLLPSQEEFFVPIELNQLDVDYMRNIYHGPGSSESTPTPRALRLRVFSFLPFLVKGWSQEPVDLRLHCLPMGDWSQAELRPRLPGGLDTLLSSLNPSFDIPSCGNLEGILSESLDRNSSCNSASKLDMLAVFSARFSTQFLEKAFLRMARIRHFHQAVDALLNVSVND